jgi:hypothetical protein
MNYVCEDWSVGFFKILVNILKIFHAKNEGDTVENKKSDAEMLSISSTTKFDHQNLAFNIS